MGTTGPYPSQTVALPIATILLRNFLHEKDNGHGLPEIQLRIHHGEDQTLREAWQ